LRRWRAAGRTFPVIVLTARGDWTEKVEGIEAGADDYMTKPFAMGELVARLRGLLRRVAGHVSATIAIGRLSLDTARMSAAIDGRPVRLSPLEYRFLDLLSHKPGHVATSQLIERDRPFDFMAAYNSAHRLKTLIGLKPYEQISKI